MEGQCEGHPCAEENEVAPPPNRLDAICSQRERREAHLARRLAQAREHGEVPTEEDETGIANARCPRRGDRARERNSEKGEESRLDGPKQAQRSVRCLDRAEAERPEHEAVEEVVERERTDVVP